MKHFTQSVNDSLADRLMRDVAGFSLQFCAMLLREKKLLITIVVYSVAYTRETDSVRSQQMVAVVMGMTRKVRFSEGKTANL